MMLQEINQKEASYNIKQRLLNYVKKDHLKNKEKLSWADMSEISENFRNINFENDFSDIDELSFFDYYENQDIKISEFQRKDLKSDILNINLDNFDSTNFESPFYLKSIELKDSILVIWTLDQSLENNIIDLIYEYEFKLIQIENYNNEIRIKKCFDKEKKIAQMYLMSHFNSEICNFVSKKENFQNKNESLYLNEKDFIFEFKYLTINDINHITYIDDFNSLEEFLKLYLDIKNIASDIFLEYLMDNYLFSIYYYFTFTIIKYLKNIDDAKQFEITCNEIVNTNYKTPGKNLMFNNINLNKLYIDLNKIYEDNVKNNKNFNFYKNLKKFTGLIINHSKYIIFTKPNEKHYYDTFENDKIELNEIKNNISDHYLLSELEDPNKLFINIKNLYLSNDIPMTLDDYLHHDIEYIENTYSSILKENNENKIKIPPVCRNWLKYGDCENVERNHLCNAIHPIGLKKFKTRIYLVLDQKYVQNEDDLKNIRKSKNIEITYYDNNLCPLIKKVIDKQFNTVYPNENSYTSFNGHINIKQKYGDIYNIDYDNLNLISSKNSNTSSISSSTSSISSSRSSIELNTLSISSGTSSIESNTYSISSSTSSISSNTSSISNFNLKSTDLCQEWKETGKCSNKDKCNYNHPVQLCFEYNKDEYEKFVKKCKETDQIDTYKKFILLERYKKK